MKKRRRQKPKKLIWILGAVSLFLLAVIAFGTTMISYSLHEILVTAQENIASYEPEHKEPTKFKSIGGMKWKK